VSWWVVLRWEREMKESDVGRRETYVKKVRKEAITLVTV
jgi:hypothetical protein